MQNLLRTYRKKTEITIDDISQLLNMPDCSKLSRCEKGFQKPDLEILFTYYLLFEVSIEKLFEKEMKSTIRKITRNIDPLIKNIQTLKRTRKVESRISYLKTLKEVVGKRI